jgi:hypothetical protein
LCCFDVMKRPNEKKNVQCKFNESNPSICTYSITGSSTRSFSISFCLIPGMDVSTKLAIFRCTRKMERDPNSTPILMEPNESKMGRQRSLLRVTDTLAIRMPITAQQSSRKTWTAVGSEPRFTKEQSLVQFRKMCQRNVTYYILILKLRKQ